MTSERELNEVLGSIALQNGFRNGHYSIVLDSEHEQFCFWLLKKYRIVHSDGTKVLNLLVKLPPSQSDNMGGYVFIPQENRFFNNVHYLTKIQPKLRDYGVALTVPKLYASSLSKNGEYIVLEDLEARGYKRVEPSQGLTKPEVALIINMLSMYHLTIRYWKTRNIQEFNRMCSQFKTFINPQNKDMVSNVYEDLLKKIFKGVWVLARSSYGASFKSNMEEAMMSVTKKLIKSLGDVRDQPWATLVNCDMWSPHLLIRYHTITGLPIDVAFEDWSSARIGSPVVDLTFLAFSSSCTSLYPELPGMLEQYFTNHISKAELEKHYPTYGIFGVYGSLVVNVTAAFENDVPSNEFQPETLIELTSDKIPDIQARLLSIVKTAIEVGVL